MTERAAPEGLDELVVDVGLPIERNQGRERVVARSAPEAVDIERRVPCGVRVANK
jgi:hypothetical protein